MTGIPPIEPYVLPTAEELPHNAVPWTIEPDRAALLIHDMQRFFVRALPPDLSRQVITRIEEVRDRCRELALPVAYSMQPGSMVATQRGLLADFWGPGMSATQEDREIVSELDPGVADLRFNKWRYSAFFHTDLLAWMRKSNRDQLLICGIYAHVGVLATALDAFTNDIQPFVIGDAVADFTDREHRFTLSYVSQCCAAILGTMQIKEALV